MRVDTSFALTIGAAVLLATSLVASPALADFQKGLDAYSSDDYTTALKEWRASADQGDARSQYGLGLLYDLGRGVQVDPTQAARDDQFVLDEQPKGLRDQQVGEFVAQCQHVMRTTG